MTNKEWRRYIKFLRINFPLKRSFAVIRKPLKKIQGETIFDPGCEKILIDTRTPITYQADILMHEWAHARTSTVTHCDKWAREYGKIYRAWERYFT